MIEPEMIEKYLVWKRTKELYPSENSPQDWVDELIMSEARVKMQLLSDMLEHDGTTIEDVKKLLSEPLGDYDE